MLEKPEHANGRTPMQIAAELGQLPVVQALLTSGVAAEVTYHANQYITKFRKGTTLTPLQRALLNGHDAIAQCLLDAGADVSVLMPITLEEFGVPNEKDGWPEGARSLRGAIGFNHDGFYQASVSYIAVAKCSVATLQKLKEKGANHKLGLYYGRDNQSMYDRSNGSTLMRAALLRSDAETDVIEYLLAEGVNPNKYIRRKWSAHDESVIKIVCVTATSIALSLGKNNLAKTLMRRGGTPWRIYFDGDWGYGMHEDQFWFAVDPQVMKILILVVN